MSCMSFFRWKPQVIQLCSFCPQSECRQVSLNHSQDSIFSQVTGWENAQKQCHSAKVRRVKFLPSLYWKTNKKKTAQPKPFMPEAHMPSETDIQKPAAAEIHWAYNSWGRFRPFLLDWLSPILQWDAKDMPTTGCFGSIIANSIQITRCDRIRSLLSQIEDCKWRTDAHHVSTRGRTRCARLVPPPMVRGYTTGIMRGECRSFHHRNISHSLQQKWHPEWRNPSEV